MMKKLLALALVLSVTMPLYAGIAISVKEMDGTAYNGIRVLNASDTLMISIVADAEGAVAGAGALIANPIAATLSGGVGAYGVSGMMPGTYAEQGFMNSEGTAGVAVQWGHATVAAPYPAGTVMIQDILFHCEGKGDVVVTLLDVTADWDLAFNDGVDIAPEGIWDSVTIRQVPEPMTMLLLGLGGLFLRKK